VQDEDYAWRDANTPSKTSGKQGIPGSGGANSDANLTKPPLSDPDLARLVAGWPRLSEQVRRAIMGMIESA
jgi:hypothetical protein